MECSWKLYCILIMGWSFYIHPKETAVAKNQLHKVYHHCMQSDASAHPSIELGSLVCYFSAAPMINSLSNCTSYSNAQSDPANRQVKLKRK